MRRKKHHELRAWQSAVDLTVGIYRFTRLLPKEELYGLSSQMRRAAVSVASNLAEGVGRDTPRDQVRFYGIARGSLAELDTQARICGRLGYGELDPSCQEALERTFAQVNNLISKMGT